MSATPRKRIYLAGPEVFLPDAKAVGRAKVEIAAEFGFEGVFPLDAQVDLSGKSKPVQAGLIFSACEGLMDTCDFAVANLTPFRGVSMDSGTAYEVGYMRARGRRVFGYTNAPGDLASRARAFRERGIPAGDCDRPDCEIEDYDLVENIMIAIALRESGGDVIQLAADGDMHNFAAYRKCLELARKQFL
ncbi:MAG: nucleoside 2-deoxyribosyltransferase [Hyphomicrobiaceae bacterium]